MCNYNWFLFGCLIQVVEAAGVVAVVEVAEAVMVVVVVAAAVDVGRSNICT